MISRESSIHNAVTMAIGNPSAAGGMSYELNLNKDQDISLKTEIRNLPFHIKTKIGQLMPDRDKQWQMIMMSIPSSPPWSPGRTLPAEGVSYPTKYSVQDCKLLENAVNSGQFLGSVGNGMNVLMEEWGCSGTIRPTLGDLLNLLIRNKLLTVASYIKIGVLKEEMNDVSKDILILDELLKGSDNTAALQEDHFIPNDSTLDNLLEEHENELKCTPSNGQDKITPSFDEEVVPHFPYSLLGSVTENFSNRPYKEGGHKVGEGAFGVVYKANVTNLNIASKALDINELAIKRLSVTDERTEKQFKLEVEVLSQCSHANILEIKGYSCDGPSMCLVYEFMSNGNLQDKLSEECDTPLNSVQRLNIIHGSAAGLAHLHTFMKTPMVHRDIKSANILLDSKLMPKIADFGLVRIGGSGTHTKTMEKTTAVFGTSAYMAPEAFRGDVSVKLDTFSFGVVLLEILTGLPVYDEERDGRDLLSHIEGIETEPMDLCDSRAAPWPEGLPKAVSDLAMSCVEEKRHRPTMVKTLEMCEEMLLQWGIGETLC